MTSSPSSMTYLYQLASFSFVHALYSDRKRFLEIREKYGPDNVFMNSWIEEKFLADQRLKLTS